MKTATDPWMASHSLRDFQLIFRGKIIFSRTSFDPCHFMVCVYPFLSVYLSASGTLVALRETGQ